jgi:hypothetical protein
MNISKLADAAGACGTTRDKALGNDDPLSFFCIRMRLQRTKRSAHQP